MIKANELRIGNCVNRTGHLFIVTWTLLRDIALETPTSNYEPIPLTEEWLVNFGFKEVSGMEGGKAFEIASWGRIKLVNDVLVSDQYYFLDGLSAEIKYIHQLQNLYFALTGTELIYKP